MTFYHDLEEQVYKGIRSNPFTGIHGNFEWRKKEILKTEASDVGLECQVSHDWEGSLGLMVEILGTTRYAAENPTFPLYVMPTQSLRSPSLTANPTAAHICTLTDKKNLLKRDWAMVRGFRRGVSKNIHDALDLEFCELLQQTRYNYMKFLPQ